MSIDNPTAEAFSNAILTLIRDEINIAIAEEKEKAIKAVEARIKESVDSMALRVLQHYDVQRVRSELVVVVRKLAEGEV